MPPKRKQSGPGRKPRRQSPRKRQTKQVSPVDAGPAKRHKKQVSPADPGQAPNADPLPQESAAVSASANGQYLDYNLILNQSSNNQMVSQVQSNSNQMVSQVPDDHISMQTRPDTRLGDAVLDERIGQLDTLTAPIGTHVHKNIREKIWRGEFIEFAELLPQNRAFVLAKEERRGKCCSGFCHNQGPCGFSPQPNPYSGYSLNSTPTRKKEIVNIGEWTDAMLIFMQIYLEKHGSECMNLLKYTTIIRHAAAKHGTKGALDYDKEFRLKKALYPEKPFNMIDGELYFSVLIPAGLFYQTNVNTNRGKQNQFSTPLLRTPAAASPGTHQQPFRGGAPGGHGGSRMPSGVCWGFNRGSCNRNPCPYPHHCSICGRSNHSATRCFFRNQPHNQTEGQQPH